MKRSGIQLYCCAYLAWALMLQGCGSAPSRPAPALSSARLPGAALGDEIAMRALSLLGAPYQWGGSGPSTFDCSGLVRFVHSQIGIATPRTAAEQYSAAKPVNVKGLTPGDLLFFRIRGSKISHVAIYTGEGRFIHAPQTGRPVELRTLDDEFYAARLAGAGRLF
jgi:cell wall-associated NlpC family hydrolase